MHLEQRNLRNSSQAYDNKLLSKFGKPETPPRTLSMGSVDASPTSSQPFYPSGNYPPHPLKSSSISDGSVSASPDFSFRKDSFSRRFAGSPQSRPNSPGLITSASGGSSFMEYRSPTWDVSTPSSATDSEQQQQQQQQQQQRRFGSSQQPSLRHQRSRRSGSGPVTKVDESAASAVGRGPFASHTTNTTNTTTKTGRGLKHTFNTQHNTPNTCNTHNTSSEYVSRPKRGSYDQSGYADSDSGGLSACEETGATALRQLQLEDRTPLLSSLDHSLPSSYYFSSSSASNSRFSVASDSRLGMKRRASSPPPEAPHDDKPPALLVGNNSSELYQRNTTSSTAHLSANRSSPQNRFAPAHGSVSSASSSGLRNGSYASSNGLSVGSSITSISSHDRLSPGGISPSSEQHQSGRDSPYVTSLPLNSTSQDSLPRSQQRPPPESKSTAAIARKMSGQPSAPPKHSGAPKIQAHVHICECCPKKPKKFDTLQELK